MAWIRELPRSAHCSQMNHINGVSGTGLDDCGISCVQRYLREAGKLNPEDDIAHQLAQLAQLVRGHADDSANGPLSLGQVEGLLTSYDVASVLTYIYTEAGRAPWAILLVDGRKLWPAQYPADWFGPAGGPNHFILWLPFFEGSGVWINDPLAYANGQQDCQYTAGSIENAFYAALILPDTGHGEA